MKKILSSPHFQIFTLIVSGLILRYEMVLFLSERFGTPIRLLVAAVIIIFGAFYVLRLTAKIIESTTSTLSHRTKLASGVLQSLGTAFPDMALGIAAALVSLQLRATDMASAINYAVIAAATTFGSNVYNIGYATWCVFRQNVSNRRKTAIPMFPYFPQAGLVTPIQKHAVKPGVNEVDSASNVINALTVLTAIVAISMVLFGKVGDSLYQLVRPVGFVIFALCIGIIYSFRKSRRPESQENEVVEEEHFYSRQNNFIIFIHLILSGVIIMLTAESMVHSLETISNITHIPPFLTGASAGIIGCLGEILVIHNFSVNPRGRLADALVGVGMDNVVTTLGASIVAIMGGIFLGSDALILIFVLILALNSTLLWQISKLKNYL